jgi:DNA repair protein RadC
LTASIVHPREVFKAAIIENAAAIILLHNHPSGDATPSQEDEALTARLRAAGDLLGIRVLDYVVIGSGCYVSFVDSGRF